MPSSSLRLCLVDMNNGVENQAIRCFYRILESFRTLVRQHNPQIEFDISYVEPRNKNEAPRPADLYICSGGPGSPLDGYDDEWCVSFRGMLDDVTEANDDHPEGAPAALLVCHSFQIGVQHFGFARMAKRSAKKFGIMPVYPTPEGRASELLSSFGERFFVWEHREWEAIDLDADKLRRLGGELWARESRDGVSKGEGLVAFRFAPGIEGTQFHPEGDGDGVMAWLQRPESVRATINTYGNLTYERMLRSVDDSERLPRTFRLLIPGWLVRRFNTLALTRDWKPLPAPI